MNMFFHSDVFLPQDLPKDFLELPEKLRKNAEAEDHEDEAVRLTPFV